MNQPAAGAEARSSLFPPTNQRWNEGLELARASAIALVVYAHGKDLLNRESIWRWLYSASGISGFFTPGWWGVRLFFALSGYLIGRQVIGALSQGSVRSALFFGLRRWIRTIPTYWMILGLFCLWRGLNWFSPTAVLNALFLQSALPGQNTTQVIEVGWSLVVEEWSYAFLAILLLLVNCLGRQTTPRQAAKLLLSVTLTITTMSILVRIGGSGNAWMNWETLKKAATLQLDSLAGGMALACLEVLRPADFPRLCRQPRWMAGLSVLGMSLMGGWINASFRGGTQPSAADWAWLGGLGYPVASVLCCCLLIALWWVQISTWPAILQRPIRLLANTSYSLYLVHLPIAGALASNWLELSGFAAFTLYALISILLGKLSWWLFEKPFLGIRQQLRAHAN